MTLTLDTIDNTQVETIRRARTVAKLRSTVSQALADGVNDRTIRQGLCMAMYDAIDRQDERIGHAVEVYRRTLHLPEFWR